MEGVKEITRNGAKFMDGQEKEFSAIILATGYKSNVPTWLKVKKKRKTKKIDLNCLLHVYLYLAYIYISAIPTISFLIALFS